MEYAYLNQQFFDMRTFSQSRKKFNKDKVYIPLLDINNHMWKKHKSVGISKKSISRILFWSNTF
jgi:hypothetical protein